MTIRWSSPAAPAPAIRIRWRAFFDFIIIGDGEQVVPAGAGGLRGRQGPAAPRAAGAAGRARGHLRAGFPAHGDAGRRSPELDYSLIPVRPVIPSMAAVHDRATLEIMRGCTRGCRFCMAGIWYRPVRERRVEDVCRAVGEMVAGTGYEEASLSSLSTTDYSCIQEALTSLAAVPTGADGLAAVAARGSGGHPAAGSDLVAARFDHPGAGGRQPAAARRHQQAGERRGHRGGARRGFSRRLHHSQTLFHDRPAHGDRGRPAGDHRHRHDRPGASAGRRRASPGRVQVNVSIASFVPKAHTPFQWYGMNSREELAAKHEFLRRNMPRKQIKLSVHDLEPSLVESAIARGGDETAGGHRGGLARRRRLRRLDREVRP